MRKVFKYLYGTGGGGGIPWLTSNSGASSSIMMSSFTSNSLPNYKTLAQMSNTQTMNTYTPKLTSSLIGSMIKNPSVNPIYTSPKSTTIDGVTDISPDGVAPTKISEGVTGPSKGAKVGATMSLVSNLVSSVVPLTPLSGLTASLDAGFNAAAGVIATANPLVGGILMGVGALTDVARSLGLGTDQVTKEDQFLDSKFLALSPVGLANSLGAKRGQTLNKGLDYDKMKADMGGGYGGIMDQLATSEKYAGKTMGNVLGQRDRANKKIHESNYQLAKMLKIWDKKSINEAIQGTQSDMVFNKLNLRMKGGWSDGAISFGRFGMIIEPAKLRMIRHIVQSYKPLVYTETEVSEEEVVQFKNGGSFNVIPEGSLHARLHHMENADGLTKKGIPVVAEKDGGELELQAEIELNEIIFRLEVTNEIEKLMKDGSDNAAIECGKMLVKEIFENTQDRTGLIESLEEPKKELEDVVKEHKVFQEGGVLLAEKVPQEKIPTLEEFINSKIQERIEAAIQKAITRKSPYMFKNKNWKNCIATATDNFGIPVVLRNSDLEANPEKYGFIRLESNGNIDELPDGVLILDFNKPGQPDTPGHTVMLVGRDDEGYPLYSYSSGDSDPKSMHNLVRYNFNSLKINVFKYNGTDQEREAWKAEYLANYPEQ